jgi:hypothetical protein
MKLTRVDTGVVLFQKAATVFANQTTNPGRIDFAPAAEDFDTVGRYRVEITVTGVSEPIVFPRGNKQRFYIWVK